MQFGTDCERGGTVLVSFCGPGAEYNKTQCQHIRYDTCARVMPDGPCQSTASHGAAIKAAAFSHFAENLFTLFIAVSMTDNAWSARQRRMKRGDDS